MTQVYRSPESTLTDIPEEKSPNKLASIKNKALKTGFAALIAMGAILPAAGCGNASAEGAASTPVATETVDTTTQTEEAIINDNETTDTNTTAENTNTNSAEIEQSQEELISSLEIPAGLDTETLAKTLIEDRFTDWLNAGAKDSLLDDSVAANQSWDTFLSNIADKNSKDFADALFIPNWESDDRLVKQIDYEESINLAVLRAYTQTAWNSEQHPENLEPYKTWFEVLSVEERTLSNGSRLLKGSFKQVSNGDKNSIGPINDNVSELDYSITLTVVDGQEKISAIIIT